MSSESFENVNAKLEVAFSHHPHLLKNKFHFNGGKVVVQGEVNTYFEKQIAQEALRNVDGVSEIQNELVVSWS